MMASDVPADTMEGTTGRVNDAVMNGDETNEDNLGALRLKNNNTPTALQTAATRTATMHATGISRRWTDALATHDFGAGLGSLMQLSGGQGRGSMQIPSRSTPIMSTLQQQLSGIPISELVRLNPGMLSPSSTPLLHQSTNPIAISGNQGAPTTGGDGQVPDGRPRAIQTDLREGLRAVPTPVMRPD